MFQELRLAKRGIQPKSSQCRNLGFEHICIKSNCGAVEACESNSPILLGFLTSGLYRSEDFGFSWCGSSFLDNGEQNSHTGPGTYESSGKHHWRTQLFVEVSDGRALVSEGEIDLATRSWNGKLFEKV
jgi:hypothetical protein